MVGGCFVTMPNDEAETRLQEGACQQPALSPRPPPGPLAAPPDPGLAATTEAGGEVERLTGELGAIRERMAALKVLLYGKFGNAIQLED